MFMTVANPTVLPLF